MRRLLFRGRTWAFALTILLLAPVWGQPPRDASDPPAAAVAEPQDISILTRKLPDSSFQPLEMHNTLAQTDLSFFSGQLTYFTVPGEHSNVRFRRGEPVEFYLKIFLDAADPRAAFFPVKDPSRFTLFPTERDGGDRRVLLSDQGWSDVKRFAGRPLIARLFGVSSFVLAPSAPLEPGEYAVKYTFEDDERVRLFCFAVDP